MSISINDSFASTLRPNPVETDYVVSQVEGEIPRELNGTLYRNGPNQKIAPKVGNAALHLFDGDALIHALRFEDGTARYKGRYARTESFELEQATGEYCIGGLNVKPERELDALSTIGRKASPNTNIVAHAGRLLALVENAPPFEMDLETLESRGFWELDGKMLGLSTTAHPKIDAKTGQMWIHGYQPLEPFIALYAVEADGSVSLAENHDAPWASMMHDFAITENYVIFPLGSMNFDLAPLIEGKPFNQVVTGRADRPQQFGIRNREPGSPITWFEAPSAGYMFHPSNAFEEDGKIFMDACTYEDPQGLIDSLDCVRAGGDPRGFTAHPYLYEFDLASGTCKETKFSDSSAEFPRIDDRLIGYKNRWGYAATAEAAEDASGIFQRITKYDRQGGASVHSAAVEGRWVGEPVFVPRAADSEEDDGFVLSVAHDANRDASAVEIFDARGIDSDPLARLWLDERMPLGFHGNWDPARA